MSGKSARSLCYWLSELEMASKWGTEVALVVTARGVKPRVTARFVASTNLLPFMPTTSELAHRKSAPRRGRVTSVLVNCQE